MGCKKIRTTTAHCDFILEFVHDIAYIQNVNWQGTWGAEREVYDEQVNYIALYRCKGETYGDKGPMCGEKRS